MLCCLFPSTPSPPTHSDTRERCLDAVFVGSFNAQRVCQRRGSYIGRKPLLCDCAELGVGGGGGGGWKGWGG